jgi:manganese/iron transport system permease protein
VTAATELLRAALLDPLGYPFMRYGLAEVALLGVACGLVGVFVVHRDLTFFAHALSHTIFPALVLAAAWRVDLALGALVGAALTVALLFGLRLRPDVGEDSAVGIVFIGLFALGVVLVGLLRVRSRDVGAALVGNVLGVTPDDLALGAGLVVCLALAVGALYRPLVLATFDRLSARAMGLPVTLLDAVLLVMVAGTVVVGVRVVGVVLTVATLVTPTATALLWVRQARSVMLLSSLLGAGSGVVGLYVAYHVPIAPAAIIVLVLTLLFLVSSLASPRGLARRRAAATGRATRLDPILQHR